VLLASVTEKFLGDTVATPALQGAAMPAHHSLHVALTRELCDFVARLVASGRYQSSSEVVRTALRLLERADGEPIARPPSRCLKSEPSDAQ
jgi:Arc/MetJ-type ribon-helix-helix transcriptional regulator